MRSTKFARLAVAVLFLGAGASPVCGQVGDLLNEAPLTKIPEEMTLEEYRDMNRRLTVGLLLSAVPVPGMVHYYAGEKRTQRRILAASALGLGSIVVAIANCGDQKFPDSDFGVLILNAGVAEKVRHSAKIPAESSGAKTTFSVQELFHKGGWVRGGIVLLGLGLIGSEFIYDVIHDILVIEKKRDLVGYEYAKKLSLIFEPAVDVRNKPAGLSLSSRF